MRLSVLLLSALLCCAVVNAACGDSTNSQLDTTFNMCFCKDGYWLSALQVENTPCNKCPNNTFNLSSSQNTKSGVTEGQACNMCAPNYYYVSAPADGTSPTCVKCPGQSTNKGASRPGISSCSCNNIKLSETNNTCGEDTTSASYIALAFSALAFVFAL